MVISSFLEGVGRSVATGWAKDVERTTGSLLCSSREARLAWNAEAACAIMDLRGGDGGLKAGGAMGFEVATDRVNQGSRVASS